MAENNDEVKQESLKEAITNVVEEREKAVPATASITITVKESTVTHIQETQTTNVPVSNKAQKRNKNVDLPAGSSIASSRPKRQVRVKEKEEKVENVKKQRENGGKKGVRTGKVTAKEGGKKNGDDKCKKGKDSKAGSKDIKKYQHRKPAKRRWSTRKTDVSKDEPAAKKIHIAPVIEKPLLPKYKLRQSPIYKLLSLFLRSLQRKDPEGIFAKPVTNSIAPEYSSVIETPMDFKTMRLKLDRGEYTSLAMFKADFELMCYNSITYNNPTTFYFKEGEKMLVLGRLLMSEKKLHKIKEQKGMSFLKKLTETELGFALFENLNDAKIKCEDVDSTDICGDENMSNGFKKEEFESEEEFNVATKITNQTLVFDDETDETGQDDGRDKPVEINITDLKKMINDDLESLDAERLVGVPKDLETCFNNVTETGITQLSFINPDLSILPGERYESPLVNHIPKLKHGVHFQELKPRDDLRNVVKPVKYLHYGPFSSYAPSYDSCFSTITNDDTRLLLTELGYHKPASIRLCEDPTEETIKQTNRFLSIFQSTQSSSSSPLPVPGAATHISPLTTSTDSVLPVVCDNSGTHTHSIDTTEQDDETDVKLSQTASHIFSLVEHQYNRLVQPVPPRLRDLPRPSMEELHAAEKVQNDLVDLVKQTQPKDIASEEVIREALSVNLPAGE